MTLSARMLHHALASVGAGARATLAYVREAKGLDLPREALNFAGENGVPVAHLLAAEGLLARVDRTALDPSLLDLRDRQGDTLLHHAARAGQLQALPEDWVEAKHFAARNQAGIAPIHQVRGLDIALGLPASVLSHSGLLAFPDPDGETALHQLAQLGHLDLVESVLSPELLTVANREGVSVAHAAANSGASMQIIAPLLTDRVLALRDLDGVSVAEMIHRNSRDYFDPLPRDLRERVRRIVAPSSAEVLP